MRANLAFQRESHLLKGRDIWLGMLQDDRILLAERFTESQPICVVAIASAQRPDTDGTVKGCVDNVGLHASDGSEIVRSHCAG